MDGSTSNRHIAALAALAESHKHDAQIQIQVEQAETGKLLAAQSGAVEQFQRRPIPQTGSGSGIATVDQPFHLVWCRDMSR